MTQRVEEPTITGMQVAMTGPLTDGKYYRERWSVLTTEHIQQMKNLTSFVCAGSSYVSAGGSGSDDSMRSGPYGDDVMKTKKSRLSAVPPSIQGHKEDPDYQLTIMEPRNLDMNPQVCKPMTSFVKACLCPSPASMKPDLVLTSPSHCTLLANVAHYVVMMVVIVV